jgi:hypothetical protein
MGLEEDSDPNPKLQKSASESRAHRDLSQQQQQYRFFDTTNFQLKKFENISSLNDNSVSDLNEKTEPVRGITTRQKKIFYDSADFFPGPKQSVSVSVQGEIEKRLKMRGIHEPSKDLDTLKQILEALQLKGLLHSKKLTNHRNFVMENVNDSNSPIVVMKPGRSINRTGWTGYDSPSPASTFRSKVKTRPDHIQSQIKNRNNLNSPTRSPNRVRKVTITNNVDLRRVTPVHSSRNENEPDRKSPNRSPRMGKKTVAEDESSTVSDSSSHTDTEVCKIKLNKF